MNTKILMTLCCLPIVGFGIAAITIYKLNLTDDKDGETVIDVSIEKLINNAVIVSNGDKESHNFSIFNQTKFPVPFSKPVIQLASPISSELKCGNDSSWFMKRYDERKVIKTICKDGSEFEGIKAFECETKSIQMYYNKWNCRLNNDLVIVMPGVEAANITIN